MRDATFAKVMPLATDAVVAPRRGWIVAIARVTGLGLIFVALAALGYEGLVAVQSGAWRMIATGEVWYALDVGSLNLVQAVTQRYVHPWLWDPMIQTALTWPAWSLFGGPGIALLIALPSKETVDAD